MFSCNDEITPTPGIAEMQAKYVTKKVNMSMFQLKDSQKLIAQIMNVKEIPAEVVAELVWLTVIEHFLIIIIIVINMIW